MKRLLQQIQSADKNTKIIWGILIGIIMIGAFFRLYHFSDWLHFELDQARDVMFVSEAVQKGPMELPLLGPKVSGTTLRIGPVFYYMEYLSAIFFGDTPQGHAFFVPILSIISIFLLYLLMRRFFPVVIALGLTYLYSISAFFVLYQRFAWNPNVLPFFLISGLLIFLYALDKKARYPGRWFVGASFLLVITTQLHFVAFFAVPFFVILALIIRRPKFSWKVWVVSFLVIPCIFYAPFFVNEWAFYGENTKAFFEAINTKKEKDSVSTKITTTLLTQARAYALILTGDEKVVLPSIKFKGLSPKMNCGDYCSNTPIWIRTSIVFLFLLSMGIFVWQSMQMKGEMRFMGVWFVAVSLTFMGISSQIEPRFFPLLVPLPYIFLGLLMLVVYHLSQKVFSGIFVILIVLFSYTNFSVLVDRAKELSEVSKSNVTISTDRIVEEVVRVSYEQQEAVAKYIFEEYQKKGYPVFIDAEPFWRRSIKYIAERKYGVSIGFLFPTEAYVKSSNYVILRTKKSGGSVSQKYRDRYDVVKTQTFGTLSVYSLRVKSNRVLDDAPVVKPVLETDGGDIVRITWKDAMAQAFIRLNKEY